MDRGAWRAAVHGGHNELDTTERLSTQHTRDGIIKETVTSTGEGLETSRPHGNCTQCSQQYTHGSQRVETTQRPINEETDQQKVVYSFSGLYIILEMEMAPHCSSLSPGESHGRRSLAGYRPWGRRSRARLRDENSTYQISATRGNETLIHATTQTSLENVTLRPTMYCVTQLMQNMQNKYIHRNGKQIRQLLGSKGRGIWNS